MKTVFFSAALLASASAFAATPIDGWYAGVSGGYTWMPNNLSTTRHALSWHNARYDSGYHAGGSIGYKSNPMRYEVQYTYINADVDRFYINNILQTGVRGETSASLGMANIYYDFPNLLSCLQPFVGAGLGYGWVDGRFESRTPFGLTYLKAQNSVFAYQATAGITYNFSENYALNLAYRYVGSDRVDNLGRVFQSHLASLGVVYRFNENNYK